MLLLDCWIWLSFYNLSLLILQGDKESNRSHLDVPVFNLYRWSSATDANRWEAVIRVKCGCLCNSAVTPYRWDRCSHWTVPQYKISPVSYALIFEITQVWGFFSSFNTHLHCAAIFDSDLFLLLMGVLGLMMLSQSHSVNTCIKSYRLYNPSVVKTKIAVAIVQCEQAFTKWSASTTRWLWPFLEGRRIRIFGYFSSTNPNSQSRNVGLF